VQTYVEFRSDLFPPVEGEERTVNPDLWGKRLADFLCEKLRLKGFSTHEPVAEDWGWTVPIVNEQFPLSIECGHYVEYPDGYLCVIEPHEPFVRKFLKKIDTRERVTALQKTLDQVLAETSGIHSKRCWTPEEFNKPSGAL
jgi:hypothetical protein